MTIKDSIFSNMGPKVIRGHSRSKGLDPGKTTN